MDQSREIEGWFLSFTKEELDFIRLSLESFGYMPDATGLKKFILEEMADDGEEEKQSDADRVIEKITQYVSKNPQQVKAGIDMALSVANMVMKKKSR